MHGLKRILTFCVLTTLLPIFLLIIPLYLRHNLYANVLYYVTESDVLEITDGVSTIFCSSHTLHMNGTFNAFQMGHRPEITSCRKHIRLKKSMILPDDTLEYWGFYLLKGASVTLSVCSRFQGASILVVKGERTLPTCGMLDHNLNKARKGIHVPGINNQVKVTFESDAKEVHSNETFEFNEKLNQNQSDTNLLKKENETNAFKDVEEEEGESKHLKRHFKSKILDLNKHSNNLSDKNDNSKSKRQQIIERLQQELNSPGKDEADEEFDNTNVKVNRLRRAKRDLKPLKPNTLLDQGIRHGGTALKNLTDDEDSSVSSFEEGLFNCYNENILLTLEFEPSHLCTDVGHLERSKHIQSTHDVKEDGYYYYIFYSDNDWELNDIHAIFDIVKPSFQYANVTKSCINQTECTFPLDIMSSDKVIVEIPTRDGIEHEQDDNNLLISTCHPRMGMYVIFPAAVLILILTCAFL